jgi:hypothetical protein
MYEQLTKHMFRLRRLAGKLLMLAASLCVGRRRFGLCVRVCIYQKPAHNIWRKMCTDNSSFSFGCATILRHAADITPVEIANVAHSMVMSSVR